MTGAVQSGPRVSIDGKFFRLAEQKFYVKGVAYGPVAPRASLDQLGFASPEQTVKDLTQIAQLGANLLRVYEVPPIWFLDLAFEHKLKVLIDVPWNKHLCFIESARHRQDAIDAVRRAVFTCARHPAVFGFSVVNEVPPDIVRWSGTEAVAAFIDELVLEAKRVDPDCLCTFTNYPPTEFLRPQCLDFVTFNVYLHDRQPFKNYLARLQMISESKPLLLGELGIDSLREGEARKSELLQWQIEESFRGGLAGAVVFSYTDDWWRGAHPIQNWTMGLTTPTREPKPSFWQVRKMFRMAPYFPLPRYPKVSVIVASYNGDRTLGACLQSLERLNYPDYEMILVDDGSTDSTSQIARAHSKVRYLRHETNLGLSVARNTGIAAASGEIVAFTDSDCRTDPDWLYYLVNDLLRSEFAGLGGPNLLPPEDSPIAAVVMASPGGPAHVMLTDRQAEHIPGCNMAFYKWALEEVGGFDPIFRRAGDDVDICWRLQQAGYRLGFSPAAFVWHYRRSTVREYLKQQRGYGEAEAWLVRKHPESFNAFGGSTWHGRIYTAAKFGVLVRSPIIYRGLFGSAGFQALYASQPALTLMLCTSLEYHVLVTLPLWVLSVTFHHLLPLAITSLVLSLSVCVAAAMQAVLPKKQTRWWSRPLVALLFLLQPIIRGWARYQGRLAFRPQPLAARHNLDSEALRHSRQALDEVQYWGDQSVNRISWVAGILTRLDQQRWPNRPDSGWNEFDVEIFDTRWSKLQLITVAEEHPEGKQLFRCRLRRRWSLQAKLAFWFLVALELLLLRSLRGWWPWSSLLLVALPLAIWFFRRQQRNLQSLVIVFLDGLAKEWKLTKAQPPSAHQQIIARRPVEQTPARELQSSAE